MAAIDTVAGQFQDAVEDQLPIVLEGKASNRYDAEEDVKYIREEEGQCSYSDGDSSEEEDVLAWDWEGRASDLTKKYNAARLVETQLTTAPIGGLPAYHRGLPLHVESP